MDIFSIFTVGLRYKSKKDGKIWIWIGDIWDKLILAVPEDNTLPSPIYLINVDNYEKIEKEDA